MKKWIALVLALAIAMSLAACGGKTATAGTTETIDPATIPEEARYGGVLDLTYGDCSDTFDPHLTTGWVSYNWSCGVFENPLARDENGNFVPNVCDFELSEDMLTLTLWPREGVTFHNGDPVEIEDVVASIKRSYENVANMKKFFAPYMAGEPVVADGKATYTFTEFNINTLYHFSHWANWVGVMPKEILDKYGAEYINQPEDCIGTGPYKLVNYQTNALIALERYDGYVPTTLECGGYGAPKKANMDKINVWINGDETSVTMALISRDYDRGDLSGEYAAMAESYGYVMATVTTGSMIGMAFNTKNPDRPIQDANLRKAIAAALDYESVAQAWTDSHYEIRTCPMSAPAYVNDIFDSADYVGTSNLELAKQYLDASGYNGEEIVLLCPNDNKFAVIWEANMKELGINYKVEYMEFTSMKAYATDNSNPYDISVFQYEVKDTVPCQISSTPRAMYWGSEEKDRLFDEIAKYPAGSEESVSLWTELSQLWVDECSVVNIATFWGAAAEHKDLVYNDPGVAFYYDAFWVNPQEHMD